MTEGTVRGQNGPFSKDGPAPLRLRMLMSRGRRTIRDVIVDRSASLTTIGRSSTSARDRALLALIARMRRKTTERW